MLTGDALARLGPDGRFVGTDGRQQAVERLDAADAQQLLQAMWRRFGPTILASELGRNSTQDEAARYRTCGPATLAQSPVEPIGTSVPEWLGAEFGDRWLISMCSDDGTQLLASVSARVPSLKSSGFDATSTEVLSAAFKFAVATPGSTPVTSAEDAALRAYRATGKRVSGVPRLVLPRPPVRPLAALWEVQIESAVPVRTARSQVEGQAARVFIGAMPSDGWRTSVLVDGELLARGARALNGPQPDSTLQSAGIRFRTLGLPLYAEVEPVIFVGRARP